MNNKKLPKYLENLEDMEKYKMFSKISKIYGKIKKEYCRKFILELIAKSDDKNEFYPLFQKILYNSRNLDCFKNDIMIGYFSRNNPSINDFRFFLDGFSRYRLDHKVKENVIELLNLIPEKDKFSLNSGVSSYLLEKENPSLVFNILINNLQDSYSLNKTELLAIVDKMAKIDSSVIRLITDSDLDVIEPYDIKKRLFLLVLSNEKTNVKTKIRWFLKYFKLFLNEVGLVNYRTIDNAISTMYQMHKKDVSLRKWILLISFVNRQHKKFMPFQLPFSNEIDSFEYLKINFEEFYKTFNKIFWGFIFSSCVKLSTDRKAISLFIDYYLNNNKNKKIGFDGVPISWLSRNSEVNGAAGIKNLHAIPFKNTFTKLIVYFIKEKKYSENRFFIEDVMGFNNPSWVIDISDSSKNELYSLRGLVDDINGIRPDLLSQEALFKFLIADIENFEKYSRCVTYFYMQSNVKSDIFKKLPIKFILEFDSKEKVKKYCKDLRKANSKMFIDVLKCSSNLKTSEVILSILDD